MTSFKSLQERRLLAILDLNVFMTSLKYVIWHIRNVSMYWYESRIRFPMSDKLHICITNAKVPTFSSSEVSLGGYDASFFYSYQQSLTGIDTCVLLELM